MILFEGPQYEDLKSRIKKEFPLDAKHPENSNPLHLKLHEALDAGESNCIYWVSKVLMPIGSEGIPTEGNYMLYKEFMRLVPIRELGRAAETRMAAPV